MSASALILVGIPIAWAVLKRARTHAAWAAELIEAGVRLGGRASTGTALDAPHLRAEIDGVTVSLEIRGLPKDSRTVAVADAVLPAEAPSARLYVGWGVRAPPAELAHIPEVHAEGRRALRGRVFVKSDSPGLAERFLDQRGRELAQLQAIFPDRPVEVLYRGGRVHVAAHQPVRAAAAMEALMRAAARLRSAEGGLDREQARREAASEAADRADTAPARPATLEPQILAAPPARRGAFGPRCALCQGQGGDGAWLRCVRCDSAYHAPCWQVATGCVAEACPETRALPM